MRQKNMDIRVQLAQSQMTTEQVAKFGGNLRLAGAHSQSFEAALVDMADGLENDPVTRQLANMSTTFRENAKNIKNMSAEEFNAFTAQVRKEGLAYAKQFGAKGEGVQAMISAGTDLGNAFQAIGELGKVAEGTPGTVEKEQDARDKATTAMATLAESINEIRGAIVNDLLGSQIFKDLKNGLADFVPSLETVKETYQTLKAQFMTHLKPSIDEFVAYLKGPGMEDLKELIGSIQQMASEYLPKIKDFFSRLLDDPKKVFNDEILPYLKEGISAMASNILTSDFGATLGALLLAGIVGLNPFGMVGSLIVAGLVQYIGWDNIKTFFAEAFADFSVVQVATDAWNYIKDWFSELWDFSEVKTDIKQLVTDAWTTIKEWFGSLWDKLFDFKIELPNFTDYLPKWLGGKGKSLFGDDGTTTSSSSSPSSSSVEKEPEKVASNASDAFSGLEYQLSQLNTKVEELKTLTSRNTTAVKALNGNIQVG
jgi:TolA-binding protein